ncbi:hypothetical protein CICLE_v10022764mg [Citrus x clementina]|uniref:FLZ-type domain-containing protein n=2 Tax=Citrus TaxID=2706 RepID=A0A067FRC3_CITSI|nr:uncharacterized protein LOC18047169 [Citrus x clementina]ESR57271.1 hypothetical protein CICLE_v10022764mg [Citrus x clementina]KDO68670.1 hypothetical protein CISIN_1g032421mg [Citrus sinensis]
MQVKRSRDAHSASFDEAGLLGILNQSSTTQPLELRRTLKNRPPSSKRERPPSGLLTASSPESLRESGCGYGHSHAHGQGQSGNFLERCYVCKKKMLEKDVFMYGPMRGFCSPDCRSKQILIDNALERIVKQPRGSGTGSSG